ncbi:hypothetical protein GCM10010361_54260 [Streptomyces olivaceiscleroticus]|uniref:Toxin-antitoxin system HicB family antitoxin n=1 Tax=Streptomyces olivaceiscleroticus TaxID=68245 RepID=A0ABP3KLU7_9ACTN
MDEVTRDLAPGSVDVRLRGLDPEFVVSSPRTLLPPGPADGKDGGTARINFRLPAHLKTRVEEAATAEGLSVNVWLVRAVTTALEPAARDR